MYVVVFLVFLDFFVLVVVGRSVLYKRVVGEFASESEDAFASWSFASGSSSSIDTLLSHLRNCDLLGTSSVSSSDEDEMCEVCARFLRPARAMRPA